LADSALEQPQVFVHRDYHSRNLMVTENQNPGILDFQDAVVGPVTYDLVSLLKDCYISWPKAQVEAWVDDYFKIANRSGVLKIEQQASLMRWFDLMGAQRHLKASGIFARLNQRDGKSGYLKDIPRTLEYILQISTGYPPLEGLADLLRNRVMPAIRSNPAFNPV
jgi:aminoglycoside/choline kinase family phosphotransferase